MIFRLHALQEHSSINDEYIYLWKIVTQMFFHRKYWQFVNSSRRSTRAVRYNCDTCDEDESRLNRPDATSGLRISVFNRKSSLVDLKNRRIDNRPHLVVVGPFFQRKILTTPICVTNLLQLTIYIIVTRWIYYMIVKLPRLLDAQFAALGTDTCSRQNSIFSNTRTRAPFEEILRK